MSNPPNTGKLSPDDVILACKVVVEQLLKSDVNDWFLAQAPGRQQVLVDDKWMLARNAYTAGIELALGEVARLQAYILEMSQEAGVKVP
ncbi:hypothetical protein V0M98_33235 (plasmid) [Pseudomonas silesiensis]|uniref:hypothetical protein n=1 Tax=Pseudomonas silesiensis TaxID=1853130 RepID=UPI0030D58F94